MPVSVMLALGDNVGSPGPDGPTPGGSGSPRPVLGAPGTADGGGPAGRGTASGVNGSDRPVGPVPASGATAGGAADAATAVRLAAGAGPCGFVVLVWTAPTRWTAGGTGDA